MVRLTISVFFITAITVGSLLACGSKKGAFYMGALGLDEDRIVVASQLATSLHVASFDMDGNLLAILADYTIEGNGPRGLALIDAFHVALSLEGDDRVDSIYLGGGRSNYIQSPLLTGTIGRLVRHPTLDEYFIVEGNNTIERFKVSGERVPTTGNSFVNGALAPCAAPTSMRSLVFNNSGQLLALQSAAATGFTYTLGATVASACTAIAALSSNVNDVINHSDGYMYYAGTNNQIYRASQTLTGSTSIFNTASAIAVPTALAELPNGDLIVASDTTDSLEVISTSGTYRGTFHKGVSTQQIHSILVVRGQ